MPMGDGEYLKRVQAAMKKERDAERAANKTSPKPAAPSKPADATGSGGRQRRAAIDDYVSAAESGDPTERQRKAQHAPGND